MTRPGEYRPGGSTLRHAIHILKEKGVIVVPREWDAAYALREINVWLRTSFLYGDLIEHTSLSAEGIVGFKVRAIVLKRMDGPGKEAGRSAEESHEVRHGTGRDVRGRSGSHDRTGNTRNKEASDRSPARG